MKIENYLKESPVFAINSVYEKVITNLNARLRRDGINFLQGLILTALVFEDGENVSPSELSKAFRTSRGNVSHAISGLEARGFLKRTLDAKDARRFRLTLKPEGRRFAYRLVKFFDRLQEVFEEAIGRSQCKQMVANLEGLGVAYQSWGERA